MNRTADDVLDEMSRKKLRHVICIAVTQDGRLEVDTDLTVADALDLAELVADGYATKAVTAEYLRSLNS